MRYYRNSPTERGIIHASQYGLKANDPSRRDRNAVLWERMINESPYSTIIMDGPGANYYMGQSPVNRTFPDCAYCMGVIDFQGVIECDRGVNLVTQTGFVGMHVQRTVGRSRVHLKNVSLLHEGGRNAVPNYMQNYTLRPDGSKDYTGHERDWSMNWGDYKYSGLNMWGQGRVTDVNVNGYPGNNIIIFGGSNIRFNGPQIPITGTIGRFYDSLSFIPDTPEMLDAIVASSSFIVFNGGQHWVGGKLNGAALYGNVNDADALPDQTRVSGYTYQLGNTLLADSIVFDGVNEASESGALNFFVTGDEANQCTIDNFRLGNSGGWGGADGALLKNSWGNLHVTAAGEHFNDFTQNPPLLPIGGFTNLGDENIGSRLYSNYRETNMGPDRVARGTTYFGGTFEPSTFPVGGQGMLNNYNFGNFALRFFAANGQPVLTTANPDGSLYTRQGQ